MEPFFLKNILLLARITVIEASWKDTWLWLGACTTACSVKDKRRSLSKRSMQLSNYNNLIALCICYTKYSSYKTIWKDSTRTLETKIQAHRPLFGNHIFLAYVKVSHCHVSCVECHNSYVVTSVWQDPKFDRDRFRHFFRQGDNRGY